MLIFEAMSKPLQFAIIGCGRISPRHAFEAARQGQLSAVCDIIPEKADALAKEYGAKAYYTIDDLLRDEKDLDLVAICTPNGLHAAHSIACLENGIHVLCEKPLSISEAEGKEMIAASKKVKRNLFVVKSTRYNGILSTLKDHLDQNDYGRLYSFQLNCFWNRPPEYYDTWRGTELDGGTLFTQFSHYIDALIWLFGDIKEVKGYRSNLAHQGHILSEDTGVAAIILENGLAGGINWSVNSFRKNMEVSLTLLAEKGSLRIGGEYMNKIDYQLTAGQTVAEDISKAANDYGFYKGSMSNHDKVYENLVQALKDPSHPMANAEDGLRTVLAIEKIYRNIPLGQL